MNVQMLREALEGYMTIDSKVPKSGQFRTEIGKCMEAYTRKKKELDKLIQSLSHLNSERSAMVKDCRSGASAATMRESVMARLRQVDEDKGEIVKAIGRVEKNVRGYEVIFERLDMRSSASYLDSLPERSQGMSEDDYYYEVVEVLQGSMATTGSLAKRIEFLKDVLNGEVWVEVNKAMKDLGLQIEVDHSIRHRDNRRESIRIHFSSD
jgi:hypothetical protein